MNTIKACIKEVFLPYDVTVTEYGSFPLKTYLPDSDIDLTIILPKEYPVLTVLETVKKYLDRHPMMYWLEDSQLIDAEIQLVKLQGYGKNIDITINQINGLFTHSFLEHVDQLLPKYLLKRAILLTKIWASKEARILGSSMGLLSSYAIEVLVLHVINMYPEVRISPMSVFKKVL
jgi:DNA polymerase sigma